MIGQLFRNFSGIELLRAALVAFLFSYSVAALFEARLEFATIPSALALGLFGVVSLVRLQGRDALAMIGIGGLFFLWYLGGVVAAPDGSDPEKIRQFGLTLLLFGLITASAVLSPAVIERLPAGLMLLGGFALSLLVLAPGTYQEGRVSFDDNNPIWMARTIGMLGLGALAMYLRRRQYLFVFLGIFAIAAVGVVMTGSRGPLTGMALSAGLMVVLTQGATRLNLLLLGGVAVVALAVVTFGLVPLDGVRGLTFSSGDASSAIRLAMYEYTLRTIADNPGGIGVGWFMFEGLTWPHNIYLEMFVEWGWGFGAFFLAASILGTIGLFLLPNRFDILKLILVYELVNACLSGDISSPRFLYAVLIIGNAAFLYRTIWPSKKSEVGAAIMTPYYQRAGTNNG